MSDVVTKLKALIAKTEENGATENEAEQALLLAMKIASKHNIDLESLRNESTLPKDMTTKFFWSKRNRPHESDNVIGVLARLFGVYILIYKKRYNEKTRSVSRCYSVTGFEKDIELFIATKKILARAFESEWETYWENSEEKVSRSDFMTGMIVRIHSKISKMTSSVNNPNNLPVVLSNYEQAKAQAYAGNKVKAATRSKRTVSNVKDFVAGTIHAENVNLFDKVQ